MVKVTFTIDQTTAWRLSDAAERLALPKSEVVRKAIAEYHGRIGRLSEAERTRMLRALDEMLPKIPERDEAGVKKELREIRRARRSAARTR
jgi:hypothetical protein